MKHVVVNAYERYYIDIDDEVIAENRKKKRSEDPFNRKFIS